MNATYYQVKECFEDENGKPAERRVWTFDNEMAAHDLIEFIFKNDSMKADLYVDEVSIKDK